MQGEEKGVAGQRHHKLSAEGGSVSRSPNQAGDEQRDSGPPLRLVDENASGPGEVSEHVTGFTAVEHGWT